MASDDRSVVQTYHEEMQRIFEVIKTARRHVNGDASIEMLALDIEDLDEYRAAQRQSADK